MLKIEADSVVGLLAINCVRCTLVWTDLQVTVRAFVSTPERAAWWVADVEDSIVMSSQ